MVIALAAFLIFLGPNAGMCVCPGDQSKQAGQSASPSLSVLVVRMLQMGSDHGFRSFARAVSNATGRPTAFVLSVSVVLIWAASGPFFHFSDSWQLVINTGTTVVTFWMVFVIHSSQNSDTAALQLKLDELIRATQSARNVFMGCEGLPEEELAAFHSEFNALQKRARERAEAKRSTVPPTRT